MSRHYEFSLDVTIVQAHQHSAGAKHSRGGASTKVHVAVDDSGNSISMKTVGNQ